MSNKGNMNLSSAEDDLNSLQFLKFAGFNDAVAHEIWQAWLIRGERGDWVIDDAIYYIKQKRRQLDAIDATDDWDAALQEMGLGEDLRRRILNPEFNLIRFTQCACYWAIDSVNEAFQYLESLDRRREEDKTPTSSSPPEQIAGHTMFFKGGTETRLGRCFAKDGGIRIGALHSPAPSDFHCQNSTYLYLMKHHDVAELYARYAEERVPVSKAVVLHIAIPNQLLSKARKVSGDDWRGLVWNSRNTKLRLKLFPQLPPRLRLYEEADILVGSICGDATHKIIEMTDKTELSVLNRGSSLEAEAASQLVIQSKEVQMEIKRQCKDYIWAVPCTAQQSPCGKDDA